MLVFIRYLEKVVDADGNEDWAVVTESVRAQYNEDTGTQPLQPYVIPSHWPTEPMWTQEHCSGTFGVDITCTEHITPDPFPGSTTTCATVNSGSVGPCIRW